MEQKKNKGQGAINAVNPIALAATFASLGLSAYASADRPEWLNVRPCPLRALAQQREKPSEQAVQHPTADDEKQDRKFQINEFRLSHSVMMARAGRVGKKFKQLGFANTHRTDRNSCHYVYEFYLGDSWITGVR